MKRRVFLKLATAVFGACVGLVPDLAFREETVYRTTGINAFLVGNGPEYDCGGVLTEKVLRDAIDQLAPFKWGSL